MVTDGPAVEDLVLALREADCLLVVPPLAHLTWPSLGVHQLQACARADGHEVAILYASALFATLVGPVEYAALCNAPVHWLLGERLFTRAAFEGAPPLGYATADFLAEVAATGELEGPAATRYVDHLSDSSGDFTEGAVLRYSETRLRRCEELGFALIEHLAAAIAGRRYGVVGATTTFDQTSAGIALLRRVKAARPECVTALGGANCEGEMAAGVRTLSDRVDHVFSGESERTFVSLLRGVRSGASDSLPIVAGEPCTDLDALPTPRFDEFFEQVPERLTNAPLWLLYETSRGCWWGAKQHCTFCGLNGDSMGFREKSPDRVIEQLGEILGRAPTHRVCMTDNIMPHRYHRTLVPRLAAEVPGVRIFYEQKANLGLAHVKGLYDAGCRSIQPGIEALDSDLLARMRKGLLARQNVALLRYARAVGMQLRWNLLWGFPGDDVASYRRTEALLPLVSHLPPPQALAHLHVDRFSPYFESPHEHGLTDVAPLSGYSDVFPPGADVARAAYHFRAAYPSGAHDHEPLIHRIREQVERWQDRWRSEPPLLHVRRATRATYALVDTRGLGGDSFHQLTEAHARAVLVGAPLVGEPRVGEPRDGSPLQAWALRNRFAVALDGWCVPLATSTHELIAEFETTPASAAAGPQPLVRPAP